jgi:hypothetical protein
MKNIRKAANKIRNRHYQLTIPWNHEGLALLPTKLFFQYTQEMRELRDEFDTAVSIFLSNNELYRSDARARLGDLYNDADYPTVDQLRDSFGVSFSYLPVPAGAHFVVDLEAAELADIRKQCESELAEAREAATEHLRDRAYKLVTRVYDSLSDPERIFKETLVDEILLHAEILPMMNLLNDPEIAYLAQAIKQDLCGYSADTLRHDKDVRAEVAKKAFLIQQHMENHDVNSRRNAERLAA